MATAIEDVKVIQIRRVTFRRVMDEYPELAAIIHDRVAGRLAGLVDDLEKVRSKLGHDAEEEMSLEDAEAFGQTRIGDAKTVSEMPYCLRSAHFPI